ncbi:MAG: hypothetical protein AAF318_19255 [Pseudomonadota bacterium]
MPQRPLFDDDGEAREATDEEFANARVGDPDIKGPVTLPRARIVERARRNAEALLADAVAGRPASEATAASLRADVDALADLVGERAP